MDNAPAAPARRQPGIRLCRVFGFPVYLSPSWLLLAVLVTFVYGGVVHQSLPELPMTAAYAVGFGFVIFLVLSVFLHELGHALVSQGYGIRVRGITLEMLGGYTEMERESPSPRTEVVVALAGPAVSAVLGAVGVVAVAVLPDGTLLHELALQLAISNIVVAIFNALPGLPLDGGRALRAGVWAATSDRYLGTRVAGWAGRVVAVFSLLVGVIAYYYGYVGPLSIVFTGLVAAFLWVGASQAIRAGHLGSRFQHLHSGRLARPALPVAADTPVAEALRRAAEVGAGAIVVADGAGRPVALLNSHAVAAIPEERRPWLPVSSVSRTLTPELVLPADLEAEDVMRAVQASPASEYLVVSGDHVVGVLHASDIANLLDPKRTIS